MSFRRGPDEELILKVITDKQNELKSMDEWRQIINATLPNNKRMTQSSFIKIIAIMDRYNIVHLTRCKKGYCTFYEFVMTPKGLEILNRGEVSDKIKDEQYRDGEVPENGEHSALQVMHCL